MSFEELLIHTITIFNPTVTPSIDSRYGDEEVVFDGGTSVPARVDLGSSNELLADRDTRVTQSTIFLEPTAVITAMSYVMWDGKHLAVQGEPKPLYDGIGLHHWEVACQEIVG